MESKITSNALSFFGFQGLLEVFCMTTLGPPPNLFVYKFQDLPQVLHRCMDQNTTPMNLDIAAEMTFPAAFVVARYSPAF